MNKKSVVVALVVLVALWFVFNDDGPYWRGKNEAAKAVAAVENDCPCPSGVCVGPQGGRYCTEEGGKKRYLKAQP